MRFTSSITLLAALSMCLPGLFAQGSQPVLQTLYTFTGGSDAAYPSGGLARDSHGVLYGLSSQGGSYGLGSAYKVTPPAAGGSTWTEAVIHSFGGSNDVQTPLANPVLDSSGNLYGATTSPYFGGVFELSPPTSGSAWAEPLILYPCEYRVALSGPVLLDGQGNLYSECQDGQVQSYSLLYERTTVLYTPEQTETAFGGIALDSSGNIFGTNESNRQDLLGTVFEISETAGKWNASVSSICPCSALPSALTARFMAQRCTTCLRPRAACSASALRQRGASGTKLRSRHLKGLLDSSPRVL